MVDSSKDNSISGDTEYELVTKSMFWWESEVLMYTVVMNECLLPEEAKAIVLSPPLVLSMLPKLSACVSDKTIEFTSGW